MTNASEDDVKLSSYTVKTSNLYVYKKTFKMTKFPVIDSMTFKVDIKFQASER